MKVDFWKRRLVHNAVIGVLVIGIVLGLQDILDTIPLLIVAAAPVLTWVMGRFHERAIVLDSGLATEEQVKKVVHEYESWFF